MRPSSSISQPLILVFLILANPVFLVGQDSQSKSKNKIQLGIKAGAGPSTTLGEYQGMYPKVAKVHYDPSVTTTPFKETFKLKFGPLIGIYAVFPLNKIMAVQLELHYSKRNYFGKFAFDGMVDGNKVQYESTRETTLNFLEFPVSFRVQAPGWKVSPYISFGASPMRILNARQITGEVFTNATSNTLKRLEEAGFEMENSDDRISSSSFNNKWDLALLLSVGTDLRISERSTLNIEIRANVSGLVTNAFVHKGETTRYHAEYFPVTIGYSRNF